MYITVVSTDLQNRCCWLRKVVLFIFLLQTREKNKLSAMDPIPGTGYTGPARLYHDLPVKNDVEISDWNTWFSHV